MNDIDQYIKDVSQSITKSNDPAYFKSYLLGQLELSNGNYSEAIRHLQQAFQTLESASVQSKPSSRVSSPSASTLKDSNFSTSGRFNKVALLDTKSLKSTKNILSNPSPKGNTNIVNVNHSVETSADRNENRLYSTIGALLASSYDYIGEYEKAEMYFTKILSMDPTGPHIGDYAVYLHRRKRDYDKADSFYIKALELYPHDSSIRLKYAGFLRHVRKENDKALIEYSKACESNPNNSDALGNYASFLHGVIGDMKKAEEYYEMALRVDDLHANNLCNYGLFLSEERKDYTKAETLYRRVLQVHSNHSNTLYNYGVMLDTHCNRKQEAEELYRKAIEIEPRHAYGLYNLAVLLEEKLFATKVKNASATGASTLPTNDELKSSPDYTDKLKEIQSLYRRGVEVDSKDPTTMADYGRFLLIKMDDIKNAETILQSSLQLDEKCDIALFHMGILHYRFKDEPMIAEEYFRNVLNTTKDHVGSLHHLARILIDRYRTMINLPEPSKQLVKKDDVLLESIEMYERAIIASEDATVPLSEYIVAMIKLGDVNQKTRCLTFSTTAIQKLMKEKPSQQIWNIKASLDKLASSTI